MRSHAYKQHSVAIENAKFERLRDEQQPKQMKRTPLRRVSKKRAMELIEYYKIRHRLLSNGAFCEFPDCVSRATQIHHLRGRYGAKLVDTKYLMLICQTHHTFIHDNPNKARTMNLLQ